MEVKRVADLPKQLTVTDVEMSEDVLTITALSTQACPCCPLCGDPSARIHTRYLRKFADLPCSGRQVRLLVQVRKCFCDTPDCSRKIFVERLTPFVNTFARVTQRLFHIVQIIGLATGGRLGVRVTDRIGIQTSRHTILRRIMALPTELVGHITELGIDDFSFKRGRTFGTLLIDLHSHQVLDVLPDRKAETAATWMRIPPRNPGREPGSWRGLCCCGTDSGSPGDPVRRPVPSDDHLSNSLEGFLSRHLAAHRTCVDLESRTTPLSPVQGKGPPKKNPKHAEVCQAKREERLAQYQQVVALRKQGFSQTAIAAEAGSRPCDRLALVEKWHLP